MPEPLSRGGDEFLLRVKGDSMIDAGILDGDIVVVRRQADARNGEIVVALAGDDEAADEATVKRFFREDGRVRLQPENDALEPIDARHVQILGKVIGVFGACDEVVPLRRTLEQELLALARGASLECLVCGEFVLHRGQANGVPRVRSAARAAGELAGAQLELSRRPGDRGPLERLEESPDTEGQDAGETPGGESRRKVAQKGDRRRRLRRRRGKGETVG